MLSITFAQAYLNQSQRKMCPTLQSYWFSSFFGSAAYQIANPSDKGKVVPGQLAGMRSMLKAYGAFLAADPAARIPRLDELSQMNAAGTLPEYLEPIVIKECGKGS